MGAKTLIFQGELQTDLDCANFRLINLDTSNLPPSGIPPTVIPPASNWLRTWDSSSLTWGFSRPSFADLDGGTLTQDQQLRVTALGIVRSGSWAANPITAPYLPNLNGITPPNNNLSIGNYRLINVADPVDLQDAVTRNFMDAMLQGLNPKQAVRCATTGHVVLSTLLRPIDGVTLAAGDRVLVKDEPGLGSYLNGIYIASTSTWTRATDADSIEDMDRAYCYVTEGTVNAGTSWVQTIDIPRWPPFAGDQIVFLLFSSAGTVTAGNGLNKIGNTLNAVGTTNRISVGVGIDIASNYVGQTSITTLGTITTGNWQATILAPDFGGTGRNNSSPIVASIPLTVQLVGLALEASLTLQATGDSVVTFPQIGTLSTLDGTETLTNKRIAPRSSSIFTAAQPSINTDALDVFLIEALSSDITSMTANLSGTPRIGDRFSLWIKDSGTPRNITWGSSWGASTDLPLPIITVANKRMFLDFAWNSTLVKWILVNKVNNI